jgi:hypothetical protein
MKYHAIYDKNGKLAGAVRAEPQTFEDGRQALAVIRLQHGQTSRLVDVAKQMRGAELLKHIETQPRA